MSGAGGVGGDMCWACCQLYARCAERLRKYRVAREMAERCLQFVADGMYTRLCITEWLMSGFGFGRACTGSGTSGGGDYALPGWAVRYEGQPV